MIETIPNKNEEKNSAETERNLAEGKNVSEK
jgi:hypothetical protein